MPRESVKNFVSDDVNRDEIIALVGYDSFISEIERGLLYLVSVPESVCSRWSGLSSSAADKYIVFCIDSDPEFEYRPFLDDFGPNDLATVHAFCTKMKIWLDTGALRPDHVIIMLTSYQNEKKRVNSAFLLCASAIVSLGKTPVELRDAIEPTQSRKCFNNVRNAVSPLTKNKKENLSCFVPFKDVFGSINPFKLTLWNCVSAFYKAMKLNFYNYYEFDEAEYLYYEQLQNGDLNWILPGKLIAFSGPSSQAICIDDRPCRTPEFYEDYFKKNNVKLIVRLNDIEYDARRFERMSFKHVHLFFPDGSAPTRALVEDFLRVSEQTDGAVAIHCQAGIGRTGTLIAAYIMKHFLFTAAEAIAWTRICRPGSIIGPQQNWLRLSQSWLHQDGRKHLTMRAPDILNNGDFIPQHEHTQTENCEHMQDSSTENTQNAQNENNLGLEQAKETIKSRYFLRRPIPKLVPKVKVNNIEKNPFKARKISESTESNKTCERTFYSESDLKFDGCFDDSDEETIEWIVEHHDHSEIFFPKFTSSFQRKHANELASLARETSKDKIDEVNRFQVNQARELLRSKLSMSNNQQTSLNPNPNQIQSSNTKSDSSTSDLDHSESSDNDSTLTIDDIHHEGESENLLNPSEWPQRALDQIDPIAYEKSLQCGLLPLNLGKSMPRMIVTSGKTLKLNQTNKISRTEVYYVGEINDRNTWMTIGNPIATDTAKLNFGSDEKNFLIHRKWPVKWPEGTFLNYRIDTRRLNANMKQIQSTYSRHLIVEMYSNLQSTKNSDKSKLKS